MKIELAEERLRKIESKRASARAYKIHLEHEALRRNCLECSRLTCVGCSQAPAVARMTKEKLQRQRSDKARG
jgi:hypothetical protein